MGFVVKAVKKVVKTVVGVVSKVVGGVLGLTKSKTKAAKSVNTLNKSLDPNAYCKIVLGAPAAPLDVWFWEVYGANGTLFDEVLATAAHRINGFKELYLESDLAINAAGVVQSKYAGLLTRTTRVGAPAQTALSVGSGTQWNSNATFDGVAHMALKWVPDEKRLPNGIPSRYTQVLEGALVYDPRRDSTVAGGSGPHRITDQSTWSYATLDSNNQPIGRNNALQALWYLIGWRVQNPVTGEWILRCGRGVEAQDINLASFIVGANNCEAAGYYTDLLLTTEDDHVSNEDKITCDGLIGRLMDPGGLWSYYANVNDTASIAVELTDADVIQGVSVQWEEFKGMSDQFNQVRGKFIYPASPVLFQAFPYPMVRDAVYEANLGVKKSKPLDFEQVLDSTLAQRLARLFLNEAQYQGEFQAGFNYRMLKAQAWSIVRYTSERFGWTKLFRVWRHDLSITGGVGALLREVDPSIWGAGTVNPPATPNAGTYYDPAQQIAATGVNVALYPVVGANGDKGDGFQVSWAAPPSNVRRTEVRYRLVGSPYWETAGPVAADVLQLVVAPLLSGATYEVAVRHISIHEVPGTWVNPTTAPANGAGQFTLGTTGTITAAAIDAALALAGKRGKLFFRSVAPTVAESEIGDTWIDDAGVFYDRVNAGGILLGGNAIVLAGFRPILPWTPSSFQPLKLNIESTAQAAATANLAYNAANTAIDSLIGLANDNVLSELEKTSILIPENNKLQIQWLALSTLAATLGVSTVAAAAARTAWNNYLATLVPAWNDTNAPTPVDRVLYDTYRNAYDDALEALDKAIKTEAAVRANWSSVTGAGKPEDGADVTANAQIVVVPPATFKLYRNYDGTVKASQLPIDLRPAVTRGGVSVRTSNDLTYGVVGTGGLNGKVTVNNTTGNAAKGDVTIANTVTGAGTFQLTVYYKGVAVGTYVTAVETYDDNPPVNNGTSGGTDSSLPMINSTSYTVMTGLDSGDPVMDVTLTATGTLRCNANFYYNNGSGTPRSLTCKAEYYIAGAWQPMNSGTVEAVGTNAQKLLDPVEFVLGEMIALFTKTGVAAGTYPVRLLGKLTSGPATLTPTEGSVTSSKA